MISPVLRAGAWAGTADGGATGGVARATPGAGAGATGLTARSGGGDVAAAADATLAVVDAACSTIPQWTQNLAPGWFSLPQAAHFMTVPPPASALQD
jgi:hypothetical protein